MSLVNQATLDRYLGLRYNVLFEGPHGVGKTALVRKTFEGAGLRWKYFSASTLDPWVDLVGVPKPRVTEDGTEVLDLVRPEWFLKDDVDAIFFDELNRAPEKVLNAVMELIQFKSINGYRLHNLKVIWAAINPHDDESTYSVTKLDPAQRDRFQAQIIVPFILDLDYFKEKYPTTGETFAAWWQTLPEDVKPLVSPRRLDYAAQAHQDGMTLENVIPKEASISSLREMLLASSIADQLLAMTDEQAIAFISKINNATKLLALSKVDNRCLELLKKYRKHLPQELVAATLTTTTSTGKKKNDLVSALLKHVKKAGESVNDTLLAAFNLSQVYPLVEPGESARALYISALQNDLADATSYASEMTRLAEHLVHRLTVKSSMHVKIENLPDDLVILLKVLISTTPGVFTPARLAYLKKVSTAGTEQFEFVFD